MEYKTQKYNGVSYITPVEFLFCCETIEGYPTRCGAGEGIGDKIVPEIVGGKKCSHICDIHDFSWEIANDTLKDFITSNLIFLFNFAVYLFVEGNFFQRGWRVISGLAYVIAVSTFGYKHFKKLKLGQLLDEVRNENV